MARAGVAAACVAAVLGCAVPAALAVPGTRVEVEKGGSFTAGELSALPGGHVLPRNSEPQKDKKDKEKEGSRRNVEKHGPKKQNARSPLAADGGVARDVKPAVSLASPLGFDGPSLNDAPFYPPDTQGDVGPTQFIVMINGRVRSYNKSTGAADGALNADTDVFWSSVMTPPTSDNFTSDPHIRYDRLSGRWFAVMIDVPGQAGDQSNRIMLAVSDGSTITDATNFHFYEIPEGVANEFADYPTLGIDKNALYIGTNQFKTNGTMGFAGTNVYVVNKASLIAGTPTATRFRSVSTATAAGPYTPQGVDNDDPNATTGYFVGVDNASFGKLDLETIANPGGTPTMSTQTLTVPSTAYPLSLTASGGVPTPSGTALDDLDDRLFAAQMQNGHIFTAHNIGVNSSGAASSTPSRDGSRWYEINPGATPSLTQSGTVFDNSASNPRSYWIPTIAASRQGIVAIGGSVAGTTHTPNAWYAARAPGEAVGTVGGLTEYTSSSASYTPPYNRWGDYSLTRVDPQDGMTLWTIQEYVAATDVWGTRVAKLRAPAPPAPNGATGPGALGAASTSLTITGTPTNGVGYFDPGSSFPNRLSVQIAGCGITVNSVTSVAPGSVVLDVDTTGVIDGAPCDVTITNPDGQTASTNALFTPSGNHAPVANADGPFDLTCCGQFSGSSVLANDTDADGDPLSAVKVTDPAHGTLALASNGTFTYTPNSGFSGSDSFTYAASDGMGQSPPATVTLTVAAAPINHAPVANPDGPFALTCCGLFHETTSVLANDTDADGDPLTAVKVDDPSHGTLALASDGTFTYTPNAGFSGSDSFSYAASDGKVQSAPAAVTLNVAAPVVSGGGGGGGGTGSGGGSTSGTGTTSTPTTSTTTTTAATTIPALKLVATFPGSVRLSSLLRRGLSGRLTCGRSCTIKVKLKIPRTLARHLHTRATVGSATVTISGTGAKSIRIRLTRTARRKLSGAKPFKLTLTGSASDVAGHSSAIKKTVSIKR